MRRCHLRSPLRQRGVAIITALLLTMLSVTIVASLFWSQQVQVRSMENQRLHLQTKWILRGALDWARLVLRQDGADNRQTTLNGVWNTPLAETRLDDYVERERIQGENFNATLSGRMIDATSRYNLLNLAKGRLPDEKHVRIYQRLLQSLQIDPGLALATATAVAAANETPPTPPGDGQAVQSTPTQIPIRLKQLDDLLAIPGYTPEVLAKLREFVIVLPEKALVNVNTAPAEVLAALVENYSVTDANGLVARRKTAYFNDVGGYEAALQGAVSEKEVAQVKSEYFLVQSRIRLDRAALDAEALISRGMTGQAKLIWVRQN